MKLWLSGWVLLLGMCLGGRTAKAETAKVWYIALQPKTEIDTLDPTTGQKQVIIRSDIPINDAGLSSDGKRIAYVTILPGTTTLTEKGAYSVWVANADGSNLFRLPADFTQANFVWLNNEQIAIATLRDDYVTRANYDFFQWELFDIPSHELTALITNGAIVPPYALNHADSHVQVFQPDSQKAVIRFVDWQIQNSTLEQRVRFQVDPAQTPRYVGGYNFISATFDGAKIAFSGLGGKNNMDIFVATDQGRSVRQLTNFQQDYGLSSGGDLAISPNGRWVIFSMNLGLPRTSDLKTDAEIMLADTDGTTPKFLRSGWGGNYGKFVWASDSRHVAVCSDTLDPKQTTPEIYVIDVDTGQIKQLTSDGWSKEVFDWR